MIQLRIIIPKKKYTMHAHIIQNLFMFLDVLLNYGKRKSGISLLILFNLKLNIFERGDAHNSTQFVASFFLAEGSFN